MFELCRKVTFIYQIYQLRHSAGFGFSPNNKCLPSRPMWLSAESEVPLKTPSMKRGILFDKLKTHMRYEAQWSNGCSKKTRVGGSQGLRTNFPSSRMMKSNIKFPYGESLVYEELRDVSGGKSLFEYASIHIPIYEEERTRPVWKATVE